MDDFETFKANREKMDPTSRKMSEHQWQQAYAAYRNARERVGEDRHTGSGESPRRRRRSSSRSGSHAPVAQNPAQLLRNEVRQSSAYGDLRLLIDLLAWIAIGVVIVTVAIQLLHYTNANAALIVILNAVIQVITIVVLRLLIHVIIDIPDIALHKRLQRDPAHQENEAG